MSRLTEREALELLDAPLEELRVEPPAEVTFVIDRNINYTNVCYTDCDFCAFYRPLRDGGAYVTPKAVIFRKVEETLDLGGTGILLQGGHHPNLRIDYYEDLFRDIRRRYPVHLHALSPSEVLHIARTSHLTLDETLDRLIDAGLGSLPGGGAEILVDRVRQIIAPKKTTTEEWLGVMRAAHAKGLSTSATMMYGTVDTPAERIEHLQRLRELQDETGGFQAFALWPYQASAGCARGEDHVTTTPEDYLRLVAVSRRYLDNIAHLQSSWVTMGSAMGEASLFYGCDDMGSVMIEENVVRAAGTANRMDRDEIIAAIHRTGADAVQRDNLYRVVRRFPLKEMIPA